MIGRRFYSNNVGVPTDYILAYDLKSDFLDKSSNANNGIVAGTLPVLTTKDGKECAYFDGSKSFKTTSPVSVNNKFSIAFEILTTQVADGVISELSVNSNNNMSFFINTGSDLEILQFSTSYTGGKYNLSKTGPAKTGVWKKVVLTFDGDRPNQYKWDAFVGGINSLYLTSASNNVTAFSASDIVYFGRRGGTSLGFVGYLRNFKIYSRVLSRLEIIALSKEL